MKRCALIIADDPSFREWLGYHVTTQWPMMMVEYSRVGNAPVYLDRAQLSRYQLIIVRQGCKTLAEMTTSIFLMRILNLDVHPEIIVIAENAEQLNATRSTKLAAATCLLASELTSDRVNHVMAGIAERRQQSAMTEFDGAPRIPGYCIKKPLAGTYSATVYEAFSEQRSENVVLKIIDNDTNHIETGHKLTARQEFETLRKLGGKYVARAYDYGEIDKIAYIAMEYCARGSIKELFAKSGREFSRVDYMLRVAEGLREIHEAGFLHLDLKPNNVMIRNDGSPVLIDFGVSKRIVAARYQEGTSFSMGSPHFMSPEQMRGEPLDVRSDIYSFGALWYRIFTGRVPFACVTLDAEELSRQRVRAPSIGYALKRYQPIVDSTLAIDREDRYSTVEELIDGIQYYAGLATGSYKGLALPAHMEAVSI
jgi:hypothetical protein